MNPDRFDTGGFDRKREFPLDVSKKWRAAI